MDIKQRIEEIYPELVEIRRDFHRHPEPGFEEKWTSARIRELLDGWGISYEYPVAGTGIEAMIQGSRPGRGNTVALRADMDALPLTENPACPSLCMPAAMMPMCP